MNHYVEAAAVGILAAAVTFVAGIGTSQPSAAGTPAIQIASGTGSEVAAPTGRIEGQAQVELRPRISGRVLSINFAVEQQVRKGDVLLTIDPAPYEAAFNKARSQLAKAQWRYLFALRDRSHAAIEASHGGSREDLGASIAVVEQEKANVVADQAALEAARANLDDTKVLAPISGIAGLPEVSVGSLVEGGKTRLTRVAPADHETFGATMNGLMAAQ